MLEETEAASLSFQLLRTEENEQLIKLLRVNFDNSAPFRVMYVPVKRTDDEESVTYTANTVAIDTTQYPTIVCLCGSTRFIEDFDQANFVETLKGRIVLSVGCVTSGDDDLLADSTPEMQQAIKAALDELHLRKIDLADEVLVINRNDYIGPSTRAEINYALAYGKPIRYYYPHTETI